MRSKFLARTRKWIGASALAILVGLGGGTAFLAASSPMAAAQVTPVAQITTPDLTAQNQSVTSAQMTDILLAGSLLISPYPAANLGERIASVTADSSGVVKPDWSVTSNWTTGGTASVPAGYLQPGESVIVADVTFKNQALFGLVLPKVFTIQAHAYLRPRLSSQVLKM